MSTITTKMSMLALFICSFLLISSECSSQKSSRDTKGVIYYEQLAQLNASEKYRLTKEECEKKPTKDCEKRVGTAEESLNTTNKSLASAGAKPLPRPGGVIPPAPTPNPCIPGNCPGLRDVLSARILLPKEMESARIRYVAASTGETIAVGSLSPSEGVKNYNVITFEATSMRFEGQLNLVIENVKGVRGEALNMPIANVAINP